VVLGSGRVKATLNPAEHRYGVTKGRF
jgi:hypothetical protein